MRVLYTMSKTLKSVLYQTGTQYKELSNAIPFLSLELWQQYFEVWFGHKVNFVKILLSYRTEFNGITVTLRQSFEGLQLIWATAAFIQNFVRLWLKPSRSLSDWVQTKFYQATVKFRRLVARI